MPLKSSESHPPLSPGVRYVLGVAAGKGGVGKSTLTVNLALSLNRMGWRIGILDADIYGPSLPKMLPPDRLPELSSHNPQRIIPAECKGIKVISLPFFSEQDEAAIVRAPIANGLIKKFLHSVDWAPLDCLLIDFPPGTGDIQLTLMQEGSLSGAVVITTPQEVARIDVVKAISMFNQMNIPLLGVVENMSFFQEPLSQVCHYPFGRDGGRQLAMLQGIPFLGEVPIDPAISLCGDSGRSLFDEGLSSGGSCAFEKIAKLVLEQLEAFALLEGNYLKQFELIWERGT